MSPSSKPRAVVVDLDSTLADTSHRRHLAPPREAADRASEWLPYALACTDDDPILGTRALVGLLAEVVEVVILTGRNEGAREATEAWLARWAIRCDRLVMRPEHEDRLHSWKADMLDALGEEYDVVLAIDDMPQGIEAAADSGIVGVLVANAWREETKALVRGERASA